MPKVSVIIVNWNRKELLKDCLRSLAGQVYRDFEIIVVDNGSTDGSEKLATIRNEKNLGFSRAVNQGIRKAKGQYIALLNNDAIVNKGWLIPLLLTAHFDPHCMYASTVLRPDGSIESAGCYLYPDGNGMCRRNEHDPDPVFPSGCAALYEKKMFDEIGLFDEEMFAYNEDTDIGIRAQKAGWKCIYDPRAIVIHQGSSSTSKYSLKKLYWVERNRLRIMRKHFTFGEIVKSIPWTVIRYAKMVREWVR